MPIFVTVQPDHGTRAECLIYATGTPMLAVHDPSASVMVAIGQEPGSAAQAALFAAQLVRAGQQFEHEARRCAGVANEIATTGSLHIENPLKNPWPRQEPS